MTKEFRDLLICNIKVLQIVKEQNIDDAWMGECAKTLQYVLDNGSVLDDPRFPINDLYFTFHLVHEWVIEGDYGAYLELSQKYKPVFAPEQAGIAFKKIIERMNSIK